MAFLVHGAQVMVMAFVGPAVAAEYASEGPKLMKLIVLLAGCGCFPI